MQPEQPEQAGEPVAAPSHAPPATAPRASGPAPRAPRAARGALALAVAGGLGSFLLMANEHQVRHGALLGALCMLACVGGLLRALGLLQPATGDEPSLLDALTLRALPGELAWLAPARAVPLALLLVIACAAVLGAGAVPLAIAAGLLLLVPAALRRPGLLAVLIPSLVLLPGLGAYGLWDPWETHYGEVAREILSRDDWISLWWAQDRWFWSKPIYIFWSEALTWSASGVHFLPDSQFRHSEWVLRLPIFTVSIAALGAIYVAVSRLLGARAGVLSSIVLATTPYFGFLSHQAITDMPFVGLMTVAVMLLVIGVHEDPERTVRRYRLGPLTVSGQELALGLFLMLALPQVLYLASRNVTFMSGLFAWHRDELLSGSGHNPKVPGNPGLHEQRPWSSALALQPMAQALFWAAGVAWVTLLHRRERRAQPLVMLAFYVVCALAFMAKGIPGFALPGLVAFLYLLTCSRFSLLLSGQLRVLPGALALLTVGMPWFVAMFIRHGPGFTNRLLVHDHLNRLTSGVHGDKGTVQYFIQQLGYGMFPWTALLPVSLGAFVMLRVRDGEDARERRARELVVVLGLWFAAAFTLFSAMTTKFHHYIFPAVPPAAVLTAIALDRMLGGWPADPSRRVRAFMLAALAPLSLVLGIAGLRGDVRGVLPEGLSMGERAVWTLQNPWPTGASLGLLALGLLALGSALRARSLGAEAPEAHAARAERRRWLGAIPGSALIAGALVVAFVGRDLSWVTAERPAGYERLIHLFVYNYDRPWPAHFDYRPILTGFGVVAAVLAFGMAVRALRPVLTASFLGLALTFSAWCLNVYMIDLSPHWGQRELVERYYAERKSASDPIVAWQMNWKGENFYTGNRVGVFVSLNNNEMAKWLEDNAGKTAYFLLEHKRLDRFKKVLGTKRKVEQLTTERDNNKFTLVRAKL